MSEKTTSDADDSSELATLGAGCFWCVEAVLQRIDGVLGVRSGYMGGAVPHPDYRAVCTGHTGHAEVVQVRFDPARLSYGELLDWFFRLHDPTTLNRQGNDVGTQYRSAIFFHSPQQEQAAHEACERWNASGRFADPIVTDITAASEFYVAENYHQNYYVQNREQAYCQLVIAPKLQKLELEP